MLYKLTEDTAYYVCPCGKPGEIPIEELVADECEIVFPRCECGATSGVICNQDIDPKTTPQRVLERNIINQTLFKRLISMGRYGVNTQTGKVFKPSQYDKTRHSLAKKWKQGMVVEAPLHRRIESAKRQP